MPWFKVDDNLGFHHKVIAAGNPAMGLWVRAGSICAQQLTDGFVPERMASTLGTLAQAEKLVSVGLWDRVDGGYRFHGWAERQPSKVSVEAERAAASDRMREYRARKKGTTQKVSPQVSEPRAPELPRSFGVGSGEVRDSFGNPDPTHPDPTHKEDRERKRSTQLPDDFGPSEKHVHLAEQMQVNLDREWPKFCDYHRSKGSTMKDWSAALNNWIRKAAEYASNVTPMQKPGANDWMRRRL